MKLSMAGAALALAISAAARGEDTGTVGNEAGADKPEWGEESGGLKARLEVVTHEHCFVVAFRLRNVTKEDRRVEIGRGGAGLTNVPSFTVRSAPRSGPSMWVTPATWRGPTSRAMRPNFVNIPAGKEMVYGRFTLGYEGLAWSSRGTVFRPREVDLRITGRLSLGRGVPHVAAPEVRFMVPEAAVTDWARDHARLSDAVFSPLAWKVLMARGILKPGMTREELLGILGEPTGRRERDGREHLRWYHDTPMHVNPGIRAVVEDGKVVSIEEYRA
ncbi:MAG: hypothetical protein ACYS9X_25035 [Planctomycetota bacterium]|jgi:hypothetical protein